MEFCSFLLSITIVGAVETTPNIMYVQYIDDETKHVEEIYVYRDDYLACLEQPVPVSERGTDDAGGGSTATDSWVAIYLETNWWLKHTKIDLCV